MAGMGDRHRPVRPIGLAGTRSDGRVVPADIPGKGRWYRVWVGSFPTRAEAEASKAEMEQEYGQKYIVGEDEPAK